MGSYDYKFSTVIVTITKTAFLVLVLLNPSSANSIHSQPHTLPTIIQHQICKQLSSSNKACVSSKPIQYQQHFILDNNRVLLFFALQNTSPIYQVAVTLDSDDH